jgi:hypothetical protein
MPSIAIDSRLPFWVGYAIPLALLVIAVGIVAAITYVIVSLIRNWRK